MIKNLVDAFKRPDYVPVWILITVIGIVRFACGIFLNNLRGPLGLFAIAICLPLLAIFVLFFIAVIVVSILLFRRTHSLVPVGMLFAGIAVVFLLPLPPRPSTPEEELFLAHRADFEYVVELARNNKLDHDLDNASWLKTPKDYEFVSAKQSIFSYFSSEKGLYMEFEPFEFYSPIIYVDVDNDKACSGDLNLEKKLADHWYVCQREWN